MFLRTFSTLGSSSNFGTHIARLELDGKLAGSLRVSTVAYEDALRLALTISCR